MDGRERERWCRIKDVHYVGCMWITGAWCACWMLVQGFGVCDVQTVLCVQWRNARMDHGVDRLGLEEVAWVQDEYQPGI